MALNRCWLPYEPGAGPVDVPGFKREIRELDLWCSSCMVGLDGREPVAVLIGCKRPPETLVHRVAVHPDHRRKGHGRHLLTSLSAKLAILGPPHLVAEVPADNAPARALFEACGWREARRYVDLVLDSPVHSPAPPGVVTAVTLDDLLESAVPPAGASCAWERTRQTLVNRKERLLGVAMTSGERIEASALYTRDDDGRVSLWNLRAESPSALAVLLGELRPVVIPRVHPDELSVESLLALGFVPVRETIAYTADAASRA